ncbi:hypothetical protein FPRO04_13582 [Fusarium proliferatum]|nr:hypothetical protein FPRO04_13582 [Fusarium proliferatum]
MARQNTKNGSEGDGDGKSVKRDGRDKVQKWPKPQTERDKAKTENEELARGNNSGRQGDETSLTKQGDTNLAVGSRKRKRSKEYVTHKTHIKPTIEVATTEAESCIEVAMTDAESCIEVALSDAESCIEVALSDAESCIEVVMPNTKKPRVEDESTVEPTVEPAPTDTAENNGVDRSSHDNTMNDKQMEMERDGMGTLGRADPHSCRIEAFMQNSNKNIHGMGSDGTVQSDGEVDAAFQESTKNDDQRTLGLEVAGDSGNEDSSTWEVTTGKRSLDSDMQEIRGKGVANTDSHKRITENGDSGSKLGDRESGGSMDSRCCEVETGKRNSAPDIHDVSSGVEVRSDLGVDKAFPGETTDDCRSTEPDDIDSSDIMDYRSSETEADKQDRNTRMSKVGCDGGIGSDEMVGDTDAYMAISGGTANDKQTNLEFGVMENSGSVETAPMNADTERQNGNSDMYEEHRNADCNAEKLVSDVDSAWQSPAQKKDPIDVHIDVAQSPHSAQMGCLREPVSPLKEKDSVMEYTGISPDDDLRRVELERSCVEKLEMKNAHLLIDMIDSLSSGKADTYYLLAFKMVLLIFPNKSWDHVRDKLPAMMGYAIENIMTGLEKRVADEVYIEYPSDKGVEERIICWNQRLELYKGIEYGRLLFRSRI